MLVTINSCARPISGHCSVTFTSPCGQGEAEWDGTPPAQYRQYHVELDIPQVLNWGKEITPTSQTSPSIGVDEDGSYLIGLIEQVEDDGCVTIRLGPSIVLLEATGKALGAGGYVRVRFDRLILYDTGL